jgi:macrodomain Ter protein organizer (MatP/YcbG family)
MLAKAVPPGLSLGRRFKGAVHMPIIQVETDQLLKAALQLPQPELDRFVTRLQALRRESKVPRLSARESELLRLINQGVPPELQQRYDGLLRKRRRTRLTRAEQQELLALTKQMEQFDVERLRRLAELAELRGVSLPELMQQLGLNPPEPEYA